MGFLEQASTLSTGQQPYLTFDYWSSIKDTPERVEVERLQHEIVKRHGDLGSPLPTAENHTGVDTNVSDNKTVVDEKDDKGRKNSILSFFFCK